ncbi:hypothetical protein PR202_ga14262 [Eleusine coracana subsp. coracana]|uniref:Uncharacterized protein n=1 Tax=Eleusine coracana subsp. coracana TaxID=191504 RepID=A0AAV5CH02_ELECO|nr:hypothetical protein PR202_ga14262 [Eleusine coracana subsp. coracana]
MAPLLLLLVLSSATSSAAQTRGDMAALAAGSPLVVGAMNDRLKSVTTSFAQQMGREFHYCIKNMDDEWNTAFNFSSDPTFLTDCMKDTDGDLPQRVCTAAEMKFFFESFLEGNGRKNYVRPNKNCNLTSWIDGCEPGWACSAGKEEQVNLTDAVNFPSRTLDCRGCCAGFFCPHGLTCMIRKYHYQPPPGKSNHTCGGADRWADVVSTDDVFCPPECFNKGSCKPNSATQDITIFGALLVGALCLVLLIIYNFSGQLLMNREKKQAKSREAAARHARETAMARERWKSAKDVAKKHAAGLQSSLSRTFSRKKTTLRTHEPSKGTESDAVPSKESGENNNNNLTDMMRSLEENPEKGEGFNVEIGEKKKTKGRHAHTQSQIFKYALWAN